MGLASHTTLALASSDIQSIISYHGIDYVMDDVIQRLEAEIRIYNNEKISIPARSGFNYLAPNVGLVEWMPLYQVGEKVTIKIVGYHPDNPEIFNLPTILSSISQYDCTTGHLIGIADGVLLTAIRTGAASAIATKYLAHENSKTLGLIGCGAQAVTQMHAISRICDFDNVLYYDADDNTSGSFISRTDYLGIEANFNAATIEEIIQEADIVCTATSIEVDKGPLFKDLDPKKHLHINAVGSDFPGKVELPMDIMKNAFICPDFVEQAMVEGECQRLKPDEVDTDISSITRDPVKYSVQKEKLTVFDSTGWALEDHVILNVFMDYALKLGIGQQIALECITEDAKNPYHFIKDFSLVKK